MLTTRANTTVATEQARDTRTVPESVPVGDWIRETTIGSRTTREHLYTVNATVYRVKNSSKFIDIVKRSLESSECKPGDQVALYSRKRGRLLAKAEIAVLETGAKVQELDSREKAGKTRRSLERGDAKIAIVDTQADLDRLLKLIERRKPAALEKIIVLGKGVAAPEAYKDMILFARGEKTSSVRNTSRAEERGAGRASGIRRGSERSRESAISRADGATFNMAGEYSGLSVPSVAKSIRLVAQPRVGDELAALPRENGPRENGSERIETRGRNGSKVSVEELRAAGIPSVRLEKAQLPDLVLSERPEVTGLGVPSTDERAETSPRRRIKSREELRRGRNRKAAGGREAQRSEELSHEPAEAKAEALRYEFRASPTAASIERAEAVHSTALTEDWGSIALPRIDREAVKAVANMDDRRDGKEGPTRVVESRFIARPAEQIIASLRELAEEASVATARVEAAPREETSALAMRMPERTESEPMAEVAPEMMIPAGKILRLARAA